jgi:YesN/AraC family two-component response regulator
LNQSYQLAVFFNNIFLQEEIILMLNENYLAKNDIQNYKLYSAKLTELSEQIFTLNQEAVNSVYNLISEQQIVEISKKEAIYYKIEYVLLSFLIIVLVYFIFRLWRLFQKTTRLQDVISYLEITRNNFLEKNPIKEEKSKKMTIPKETEEMILNKQKKFELTKKFTNKDISLAVLSGQFDTNTKYLSEVINSHYQINFNTYINKLRVNYIVEKIKKDPNFMNYKISYLAEYNL